MKAPKRKTNKLLKRGGELELGFLGKALKIKNDNSARKEAKGADKLSYKKLMKMITTYHPCDPDTQRKFEYNDSVTIHNFGLKLMDACGCLVCYKATKKCKKTCRALCCKRKLKKEIFKPETMKDVPDSDSDTSVDDTFDGLHNAAIYLGEGAVLYL